MNRQNRHDPQRPARCGSDRQRPAAGDPRHRPERAPFPWFGGKAGVAWAVWQALGDPQVYIEPFFGSGAALLARPAVDGPRREIANDADGFVANYWRSTQRHPDRVANYADWPSSELDLCARHRWLNDRAGKRRFLERMRRDPHHCDARRAGWWVWGVSNWVGAGFVADRISDSNHKKPRLNPNGVASFTRRERIAECMGSLSARLRHAIICCGDWRRAFMRSDLYGTRSLGIFLDPPYDHGVGRDTNCYAVEMADTSAVGEFCRQHGRRRNIRIVLAGFEGEYDLPGWRVVGWRRAKSYAKREQARANLSRERLWLSPHCAPVELPPGDRYWWVRGGRRAVSG
ncbi:MAG: hypothetical protein U1A27_00295 [Phycisphaerae bacterium]